MSTIADLMVKIGVDADGLESGLDSAAGSLDRNFGKLTAGGVAAGAAIEGLARKTQPTTEAVQRMAASIGASEQSMRDAAAGVGADFDEVVAMMEVGRQQGIKSADQLAEFADFWDKVGDAAGESNITLAEGSVALRAVGIEAGNEAEALAALGFVTQETTGSTAGFLKFLERTGPQLREMGVGVDDAAAILGVLEKELGMSGRTARTEFRKAVGEADGDLGKMLSTLGVSQGQFETYRQAVSDSSGVIERNAEITAGAETPLFRLQERVGNLIGQYGGLIDAASTLALPLMALGPISKITAVGLRGIGTVAGALPGAFSLVTKGFMILSKVLLANPWILVAAAIIALVVVVVKNWDTIKRAIGAAWDWVWGKTSAIWATIQGFFRRFWPIILGIMTGGIGTVVLMVVRNWDKIRSGTVSAFNAVVRFISGIPGKILRALGSLGRLLWDAGKALMGGLVGGIKAGFGKVTGFVGGIAGKIKNLKGPERDDRRLLLDEGHAIMRGLTIGIESGMPAMERSVVAAAERITRAAAMADPRAALDSPGPSRIGGAGSTLVVNVQGSVLSERELVGVVRRELDRGGLGGLG